MDVRHLAVAALRPDRAGRPVPPAASRLITRGADRRRRLRRFRGRGSELLFGGGDVRRRLRHGRRCPLLPTRPRWQGSRCLRLRAYRPRGLFGAALTAAWAGIDADRPGLGAALTACLIAPPLYSAAGLTGRGLRRQGRAGRGAVLP